MAMFIVKPWYRKKNPDDYFDPVTHIATEENFIKFLECGVYDSKYIGYKVQLGNSTDYNNGLWVIADVNHDSANTGQTNCYDLMSSYIFSPRSQSYNIWRSSTVRTWLNNTFYSGFSNDFKSHIINMRYESNYSWYSDDKIILPSKVELGGITGNVTIKEGIKYPQFTTDTAQYGDSSRNATRIRKIFQSDSSEWWWTRSKSDSSGLWSVYTDGQFMSYPPQHSFYLLPLFRVQ
jgi:hypothetical protein